MLPPPYHVQANSTTTSTPNILNLICCHFNYFISLDISTIVSVIFSEPQDIFVCKLPTRYPKSTLCVNMIWNLVKMEGRMLSVNLKLLIPSNYALKHLFLIYTFLPEHACKNGFLHRPIPHGNFSG